MRRKPGRRVEQRGTGMVRGTILQLRRRCGKPQCHCAEGEPHVSWVLSYSEKGRTRMLVVWPEDVPALRGDLNRYRAALSALERQALAGIAQWRRRKT
jgi:hypothetical protein